MPTSKERRVFIVEDSGVDERLDLFLNDFLDLSRSYIQKLIKNGNVTINGSSVSKTGVRLAPADRVEIVIPPPEDIDVSPEQMDLSIVYEDSDVIVIDKPKGMVVHPAVGHYSGTLVNGLLYHCQGELSGINGILRPGIVHRIDKDTTGLLVACKNDKAHISLAEQFAEHSITRSYQAICIGNIPDDEGTVDAPIGRNQSDRKKMAVLPSDKGRRAVTHYKVLNHLNNRYNLIECSLETGRTHQIRVHMSYIKHPILGDTVYGPELREYKNLMGQTLHANLLGFLHPSNQQYMEFESALPQYFVEIIDSLKI